MTKRANDNPKNNAIIFFILFWFLVGPSTLRQAQGSGTLTQIKSVNKYRMAITTINTAAENSMKLIFFITPGLKVIRTVK